MKKHNIISETDVMKIMRDLFEAIDYLHSNKIVHRDIKPANVLFGDNSISNLKLIDFGLSRVLKSCKVLLTSIVGTMYYIAPEIIMGHVYNEKVDCWSLGVLMY